MVFSHESGEHRRLGRRTDWLRSVGDRQKAQHPPILSAAGVRFPGTELPGVDLAEYLRERRD